MPHANTLVPTLCLSLTTLLAGGEKGSLKEIESLAVVVEPLKLEAERDGLNSELIKTQVELRLRGEKIRVDTTATAILNLNINSMLIHELDHHVYCISVGIQQDVFLKREAKSVMLGTTWDRSMVGLIHRSKLREEIRDSIDGLLDFLINDYLSVNPHR